MKYQITNKKNMYIGLKNPKVSIFLNYTNQKSLILDEITYESLKAEISTQIFLGNVDLMKLQDCQVPSEQKQTPTKSKKSSKKEEETNTEK